MVIAGLEPQRQRNARRLASRIQQVGTELFSKEGIGLSLIHQKVGDPRAILDQRHRIMATPGCAIITEIAAQRFLAPGHLRGGNDRGEGGHGFEPIGEG